MSIKSSYLIFCQYCQIVFVYRVSKKINTSWKENICSLVCSLNHSLLTLKNFHDNLVIVIWIQYYSVICILIWHPVVSICLETILFWILSRLLDFNLTPCSFYLLGDNTILNIIQTSWFCLHKIPVKSQCQKTQLCAFQTSTWTSLAN